MYTISGKLKTVAFVLMILGAIGVAFGFLTSHKSLDEVKEMIAEHGHHGESHDHETNAHVVKGDNGYFVEIYYVNGHGSVEQSYDGDILDNEKVGHDSHHSAGHGEAHHGDSHAEHVQHQLANRPWAALYVAAFFFFMIALGVLAFYAVQYAAQAGWSPLLLRVMEGITAYMLPGALIVLAIALASGIIGHYNLFIWMDPDVVAHDEIIQNKSGYLSLTWFAIR